MKAFYERLIRMYNDIEGIYSIDDDSSPEEILPRLFILYNNFNADETYVEQVEESIIYGHLFDAIAESEQDEDLYEIVHAYKNPEDLTVENLESLLSDLDNQLVESINKSVTHKDVLEKFKELNIQAESNIKVSILINLDILAHDKSNYTQITNSFISKLIHTNYYVLFQDDIEEIVDDVENPKLSVPRGILTLADNNQILTHGEEKSAIVSISAKSLKEAYLNYSTKGLFASNLRYYVKSAKIDKEIKNSILSEPSNFWYFNNGIIVTCSNYQIKGNTLLLENFSIVNGGQTTNLIGNTEFNDDFSVLCKIILPQTNDNETNDDFLAKVAEASNTQKPIKARDLIANMPEQRKLKVQYKRIDVFLHVKRGEKIDKNIYPEKWQNASNDEVGQMLYSFVYQKPGSAKNSKSGMLMNKDKYRLIYENHYSDSLLLSFQYIKVAFNDWKTYTKKHSEDIIKIAIASNSIFMFYGIIGMLAKLFINKKARNFYFSIPTYTSFSQIPEFYDWMILNDIGYTDVFLDPTLFSSKHLSFEFFDFIYETFLKNTYEKYKKENPNFGPGHFTKSDNVYYDRVIRYLIINAKTNWNINDNYEGFLSNYFVQVDEKLLKVSSPEDSQIKIGLREELIEYRNRKHKELYIKAYMVFKNTQLDRIVLNKPINSEQLKHDGGLTFDQISRFGDDIIGIVKKYLIQ